MPFVMMSAGPLFAQPAEPEAKKLQAKIAAAALALGSNPRFKSISPKYRQALTEFVAGNMLFVLLHEFSYAAVNELELTVLERRKMRLVLPPPRG